MFAVDLVAQAPDFIGGGVRYVGWSLIGSVVVAIGAVYLWGRSQGRKK